MQQVSDITDRPEDAAPVGNGEVPSGFSFAVEAAASAEATAVQLEMLGRHREAWRWELERLLHRTDEDLESVRSITTPERDQIVADFEQERDRLEAALARLGGPDPARVRRRGAPAGLLGRGTTRGVGSGPRHRAGVLGRARATPQ
jgi:hypothetical protein